MNGKVERAVQTMEGQIISMALALEMRYGVKIDENHSIWPWMVSYAAILHNLWQNTVGKKERSKIQQRSPRVWRSCHVLAT